MGKASTAKAKTVSSGPPQLYEEATSGPSFVVDIGPPTVWACPSNSALDAGVGGEESATAARWGHAVELSPGETVLCVVGGRPCSFAETSQPTSTAAVTADTTVAGEATAFALMAWTTAQNMRTARATHVWQPIPCQVGAVGVELAGQSPPQSAAQVGGRACWPHFAPWWVTWAAKSHEGERPACAWADGGWADGRRLVAGPRAFTATGSTSGPSVPPTPPLQPTRSHHSVTPVGGVRYRFGGETQEGTVAALDVLDDAGAERSDEQPAPPPCPVEKPPADSRPTSPSPTPPSRTAPARAAHGACCLSQRYVVVFGGRRVEWAADGAEAGRAPSSGGRGGGNNSPGKAPVAAKSGAPRAASANKRPAPAGKASDGVAATEAVATAVLTGLRDVAVFDTRLNMWLPVSITGGAGPRARYAAAVAAVPSSSATGSASALNHREVLVVGGLDAAGQVCADAWLLQITSGADGELADAPKDTSAGVVPVVAARWVRLNLPNPHNAPATTIPAASPSPTNVFARHHAAAVASSQRIAYVVGGCGGEKEGAALPCVYTLALPHLTAATVRVEDGDGAAAAVAGAEGAAAGHIQGSGARTPPAAGKK